MDMVLHAARIDSATRGQRRHTASASDLPVGAFILWHDQPHLVRGADLLPYQPEGYGPPVQTPEAEVTVLTPMPMLALTWKSRRFQMASVETFGAIWVETEEGRSETNVLTTRVYADGILVAQTTDFNRPMRLPSFLAQRWEIEIEGTATISAIQMATTIEEMGQ
jgi:hypothetical protein